jgi:acyl-coenzyme A synthetase/AMP-(fatty) acid ligase
MAIGEAGVITYADFVRKVDQWRAVTRQWEIEPGDRVGLVTDHHVDAVALLQALLDDGCIVIPLSVDDQSLFDERLETACANKLITVMPGAQIQSDALECRGLLRNMPPVHPLLDPMVSAGSPGFVIFTSGSTGKGKAVLWDYGRMVKRHREKMRQAFRTLLFYKFDHIGGLDTIFHVICNGGTIVTCRSRQAQDICACIEKHSVELLPATPSFLTMLLMSGVHRRYDLSSLKVISYGTEVMPSSTLAGLHRELPGVALKQTYGLSELGVLATRSKDSSSKWMKMGGEGVELDVRDGTLWVRSDRSMVGYLNAPSPFDAGGWYNTGDKVEVNGDYLQILGRESEIINVAGEKVFPAEIESFLLTLDNVRDVIVKGKRSPVVGQMVWADFLLERQEDSASFRKRIIEQCQRHLAPFKVPGLITIARTEELVGSRFKKIRRSDTDGVAAAAPAAATGEVAASESSVA